MIELVNVRHAFPEGVGRTIDRPNGVDNYTFLHFFNPVLLSINGRCEQLPPHATLIYDVFSPQYYKMITNTTHDWFHFTLREESIDTLPLVPGVIYYPKHTEFITKIVREMESEFFSERTSYKEILDCKVRELFIKILRATQGEMDAPTDKNTAHTFRALRTEIFLSLEEEWTVERMARAVNLSPSRFFTVYKNVFQTTPVEDLILARMSKAKDLLASGELSIGEVAHEVGYVTLPHFTRLFTKHTGLSPRAYREKYRIHRE